MLEPWIFKKCKGKIENDKSKKLKKIKRKNPSYPDRARSQGWGINKDYLVLGKKKKHSTSRTIKKA